MIKAFNDRIIGIVDDNEGIRRSLKDVLVDKGYNVKTYETFKSIKNWEECHLWIFDNDTGEQTKGVEYASQIKNSILFTASYSFLIDDLKNAGRMVDKFDTDILFEYIDNFFKVYNEKRELIIGEKYTSIEITFMGYEYEHSDTKNIVFYSSKNKKTLLFKKEKETLILIDMKG